ncbi:unnamed protein product [Caenorhabditis nigoni]
MEVLYLTYGIPSIILTLFFLIFLNRTEFKYSFYRILQCDLIVNVFCFLNGWFSRFSKWTYTAPMMLVLYENFYFAFHFNQFSINFFYNLQSMSVIIMSLHRLSSSEFINANDVTHRNCMNLNLSLQFWTKYYLPIYILIALTFVCFNLTVYLGDWRGGPLRYNEPTKVFVSSDAKGMTLLLPYMLLVFDQNVRKAMAKVIGGHAVRLTKSLGKDSSLMRTTSVINVIRTN